MRVVLPYVSIKPNSIVTYAHFDSTNSGHYKDGSPYQQPKENKSHGLMSYKANKRVRLAIDWMVYLSKEKPLYSKELKSEFKFKLNFITLTLCSKQKHSDNVIKSQLLNQFLTEIRIKYNCKNYLWRAESQRNGNIHFHVVTDVFVPWRTLRTDWNRIQEKLGYVSFFTAKTGKFDPNSTDVHSINAIKNLSSYLAKYCSKNSHGYVVMASKASALPFKPTSWLTYKHPKLNLKAKFYRQIHGKLWGLSQTLSKYQSATCEITEAMQAELKFLQRVKKEKVKFLELATCYYVEISELLKRKCGALASKFLEYASNPVKIKSEPVSRNNIFETLRELSQVRENSVQKISQLSFNL